MLAEATGDAGHYRAALGASRELGMRPVEALCHAGLATLAARTGDGPGAKEHATRALEMLRAMDMRYWVAQAESALAQSGSRTSRNP
jgi:hypothetical protein